MELNFSDSSEHKFLQVYNYYKTLIQDGTLKGGVRLPSIRKASQELLISRTTVESAYLQLAAEGYIISRPQSGYYVNYEIPGVRQVENGKEEKNEEGRQILYDFTSNNIDRESFQFDLWRRYVKSALRQDERLLFYGDPQGEAELRDAISVYLTKNRNVICSGDDIVIGAGFQSLLHILVPRLKYRKRAYFSNAGFVQGRQIFEDYGFETYGFHLAEAVSENLELWEEMRGSVLYFSALGRALTNPRLIVKNRMELLRRSKEYGVLIIEDDYGSEFGYGNYQIPSLQGLSGGEGVIYLGTFSRMLIPSIRMSYMVALDKDVAAYNLRLTNYNQTASKAEQIALCQFIRDGHLERQIRKTRRMNREKTERLCRIADEVFGSMATATSDGAGMGIVLSIASEMSPEEAVKQALAKGVEVRPAVSLNAGAEKRCTLALATTPMTEKNIYKGLSLLKEVFVHNR